METVGIVGLGATGAALRAALVDAGVVVKTHDEAAGLGEAADLAGSDVVFVCVPVHSGPSGSHDVTSVWSAIDSVAPHLQPGAVIAISSTVAPGTCEALSAAFPDLELVTVPSFIVSDGPRETVTDPDRIVVGTTSPEAAQAVTAIMSKVAPGALLLVLPPLEAELVKLCSNAMLAAKVAVANELAGVCAAFDSSWERIQAAVGLDRRIGRDHLGVTEERGFEGALARDLDGLVAAAASAGYAPAILQEMARFNRRVRSEARARRSTDPVRTV